VDLEATTPTKSIFRDLPGEVDQIWAEAMHLAGKGEELILSSGASLIAADSQELHKERNPKEGVIVEFLAKKITADWYKKKVSERRDLMLTGDLLEAATVSRDRICAAEIYIECFKNISIGTMKRTEAQEINNILRGLPEWEYAPSGMRFGGDYGNQRGYRRVNTE
jgi:hypothetical protein